MKKAVKKFLGMSIMLAMMLQSIVGLTALAANTTDTEWGRLQNGYYPYTANTTWSYRTEARDKHNDTSVYAYYNSGSVQMVFIEVWKAREKSSYCADRANATLRCARSNYQTYYVFPIGLEKTMYNDVYESSYPYAYINITTNCVDGTAAGLWSPDSTREYN